MRWAMMLVVGLGGCTRANPGFDPSGAEGATSASTADASTTSISASTNTDTDTAADSISTSASTLTNGTSTSDGDPGESTLDPTFDTTGAPEPDGCPGGGPLDPLDLAGEWWTCEHGIDGLPPADGCTMLDDDGLRLQPNGDLANIYWNIAPEVNCQGNPGRCFPCNLRGAGPFAIAPWGTWSATTLPEGAVEITIIQDGDGGCTGTMVWHPVPGQPYVRVDSSFEEACSIIEGEPNIPSEGPWFMRLLEPI